MRPSARQKRRIKSPVLIPHVSVLFRFCSKRQSCLLCASTQEHTCKLNGMF